MTPRQRIRAAIRHEKTDKTPIDLGGSVTTGIHASALAKLRKAVGLRDKPIKIIEPMMMLGEVEDDIRKYVQGDTIGLNAPSSLLGYKNANWKEWRLPDGTAVLMGGDFQFTKDGDGTIYTYPRGNLNARPSARMPADGYYFDNIVRQENLLNHEFNARADYGDQYSIFTEDDCIYYQRESRRLFENTEYSVFGNYFLGGVGDIFHIPGAWLDEPKGIRDLEEWMIAIYTHPDYVREFFQLQMEIQLKNLEMYREAVEDRIDVIAISGTDFGSQDGLIVSRDTYQEFYKPYHRILNDWVHKNTNWKVFYHSCGSIVDIMEDFIEIGVDIINPVQVSARGMTARNLKIKYGDRMVFWGGSVNPQRTFAFGTKQEVMEETRENIDVFSKGSGYVCASIHNIQAKTPTENIIGLFEAANEMSGSE
jgi:hypothetical protein